VTFDEDFMAAIGHPTRLSALALFEQRPGTARELADHLDIPHTRATSHIRRLADNDLIVVDTTREAGAFTAKVWRTRTNGWIAIAQLLADAGTRTAADVVRFPAWPTTGDTPAPGGELGARLEQPAENHGDEDEHEVDDGPQAED
jgi:DNA-binding MarR family transcriptional regulator